MVICIGTIEILSGTIVVQFELLVDHEMGLGILFQVFFKRQALTASLGMNLNFST